MSRSHLMFLWLVEYALRVASVFRLGWLLVGMGWLVTGLLESIPRLVLGKRYWEYRSQ